MRRILWLLAAVVMPQMVMFGQCGQDYDKDVKAIAERAEGLPGERPRAVFAGSSSFRLWRDMASYFPEFEVVNAGIGGSCFSDLWKYRQELIVDTKPDVLVLYEGDNDIVFTEDRSEILANARNFLSWVREEYPGLPVYMLSPKPSPARWNFMAQYQFVNRELEKLCLEFGAAFVDCWPVLTDEGEVIESYFIGDRLHLNDKGNAVLGALLHEQLTREMALNNFMDNWHDAAAHADYLPYFQSFASPGSIFQGTDGTEYWTAAEFREWASPHFSGESAWTFLPTERQWYGGNGVWWFSERLDSEHMGKCRGTGVVVESALGGFKLDHYSLSIEVPNEVVGDLMALTEPSRLATIAFQKELNASYLDSSLSPLSAEDRAHFEGHRFYPFDREFVVEAVLTKTPKSKPFDLASTKGEPHRYRQYGVLDFTLQGRAFTIPVYQSLRLMKVPEYEDYLFFPFRDLTNGVETYGTGRFLDLSIPESDRLILNFNLAYNPYCAYSDRYSCPITPQENFLELEVRAGIRGPVDGH